MKIGNLGSVVVLTSLFLLSCATARHDDAAHRHPSSDAGTQCSKWSDTISDAQVAVIREVMSNRLHRLHHALWHAARGGLSASESTQLVNAFGTTWSQVHPLCPQPGADSESGSYNPVGEDFLYMHREMIGHLRAALVAKDLPCITGFPHPPTPEQWPMPHDSTAGVKSPQALEQFLEWDKVFQDPTWLRSVSLSQLGWALEFSIHNNLHMRFSTDKPPRGFSGVAKTGGAPIPYNGRFPGSWKYDAQGYDWLADPYGAAVNPTFWKIHGYVDHMIDLWLEAHGYHSVALDCHGKSDCYAWKGTWMGDVPAEVFAASRAAAAPGAGTDAPPVDPTVFNQKRMRLQHVGVLTPADVATRRDALPHGGPQQAAFDPVGFVSQKLCSKNWELEAKGAPLLSVMQGVAKSSGAPFYSSSRKLSPSLKMLSLSDDPAWLSWVTESYSRNQSAPQTSLVK